MIYKYRLNSQITVTISNLLYNINYSMLDFIYYISVIVINTLEITYNNMLHPYASSLCFATICNPL